MSSFGHVFIAIQAAMEGGESALPLYSIEDWNFVCHPGEIDLGRISPSKSLVHAALPLRHVRSLARA
jgi:hypothetical protein